MSISIFAFKGEVNRKILLVHFFFCNRYTVFIELYHLSLVARKPVFEVADQV